MQVDPSQQKYNYNVKELPAVVMASEKDPSSLSLESLARSKGKSQGDFQWFDKSGKFRSGDVKMLDFNRLSSLEEKMNLVHKRISTLPPTVDTVY